MTDTTRTKWILRFWLLGTILFSAVVLYGLVRGGVELYQVAALLLFAGMTMSTLRKHKKAEGSDPDST